MFLESEDSVPKSDIEDDKLNFRDNLKLAIQHSNETKPNIIEKHLEVKKKNDFYCAYISNFIYTFFFHHRALNIGD